MTQGVRTAIRKACRSGGMACLVVVVVAVAGVLLWLSHGFGPLAPSQLQLSAWQQRTYLADGQWAQRPLYRPAGVTLSGDGSFLLTAMTWSSWTTVNASGVGTGRLDDCQPTCAGGTYRDHPVVVRLGAPKDLCGRRFFTAVTVTWTSTAPPGWSRSDTWPQVDQC